MRALQVVSLFLYSSISITSAYRPLLFRPNSSLHGSHTTESIHISVDHNNNPNNARQQHDDDNHTSYKRRDLFNYSLRLFALSSITTATTFTGKTPPSAAVGNEIQFNTSDDIPREYLQQHLPFYGFVERIIDGDTIRVRHIPNFVPGSSATPEPLRSRGIADVTLKIRLYGVDTPEVAKTKDQISQPYGPEAKEFTSRQLYHQVVELTCYRRDQYARAICQVKTGSGKDLSVALLQNGLAEVYIGGNAEYAGQKRLLEQSQEAARRNKIGIWSLGDSLITAAEAKACIRAGAEVNACYREGVAALAN